MSKMSKTEKEAVRANIEFSAERMTDEMLRKKYEELKSSWVTTNSESRAMRRDYYVAVWRDIMNERGLL